MEETPVAAEPPKKGSKAVWIIVAIIVVLIIGAGIVMFVLPSVLYFWVSGFTSTPATPTSPQLLLVSCVGATPTTDGTLFIHNTGTAPLQVNEIQVKVGDNPLVALTQGGVLSAGGTITVDAAEAGGNLYAGTTGFVQAVDGSLDSFTCEGL